MRRCVNTHCFAIPMNGGHLCINCQTVRDVGLLVGLCLAGAAVIVCMAVFL